MHEKRGKPEEGIALDCACSPSGDRRCSVGACVSASCGAVIVRIPAARIARCVRRPTRCHTGFKPGLRGNQDRGRGHGARRLTLSTRSLSTSHR